MAWQIYISLGINGLIHCPQQLVLIHLGVDQFHHGKKFKFTQNLMKFIVNQDAFWCSDGSQCVAIMFTLSSYQVPNMFTKFSMCSPTCFPQHLICMPYVLANVILPFIYISGPKEKNFIFQNITFYFGEPPQFPFF